MVDLSGESDPRAAAERRMRAERSGPADLTGYSLYACAVLVLSERRVLWYHHAHHSILVDAERDYRASPDFAADRALWLEALDGFEHDRERGPASGAAARASADLDLGTAAWRLKTGWSSRRPPSTSIGSRARRRSSSA